MGAALLGSPGAVTEASALKRTSLGVLYAVRACGHAGGEGHRGDTALVLRGLGVGHDLVIDGVHAGEALVLTLAVLEGPVLRIVGGFVSAADAVEPVRRSERRWDRRGRRL